MPGTVALILFAWVPTRIDMAFSDRAYAAYPGMYVVGSPMWLWHVEGMRLNRWDVVEAGLTQIGGTSCKLATVLEP